MKTNIDTFLNMGKGHAICQDYIVGDIVPFPHIILSDGCSGSDFTDVGARILTLTARRLLTSPAGFAALSDSDAFGAEVIRQASLTAQRLGLEFTALDATLWIAYRVQEQVILRGYGDGYAVLVTAAGEIMGREWSYAENAPYYLSYQLDSERDRVYREKNIVKRANGAVVPTYAPVCLHFSIHEFPVILLASDGMASFSGKSGQHPALTQIFAEAAGFKNTNGQFLKRRLKRMLKDFEQHDLVHHDDLAVGAFVNLP